uniref:Uncharacterized protein n=1 Tax=Papio anubis TaxID=9555 RepID=A0A8I5NH06_PAPAN
MEFYSCHPGWSAVAPSWLTATSASPVSASQAAEFTGACHHAQLIFVVLVETGFHHVGQAGLELLTSGDPPALREAGLSLSRGRWVFLSHEGGGSFSAMREAGLSLSRRRRVFLCHGGGSFSLMGEAGLSLP